MSVNTAVRAVAVVALIAGAGSGSAAAGPLPQAVKSAARARWMCSDEGLRIHPIRSRVEVQLGMPGVVPFGVAEEAPFRRDVPASATDGARVRVVDQGQVAAGSTCGIAVVVGVREGLDEVVIGGVKFEVLVTPAAPPPGLSTQPRVIAPADGAGAWGTIGVCVSWWRPGAADPDPPRLQVAGSTLEPIWTTTAADGPLAMAAYEVDTGTLPVGDVELRPECAGASSDAPAAGDQGAPPAAVRIRVLRTEAPALTEGECEASYDLPPLPEDREEPKPAIGRDERASGGRFFSNAGTRPHFRFPVDVPEGVQVGQGPGWYQVILTAAGDEACAALPAVGLSIDEGRYPVTRSSITMPAFHRVPVGVPVRLEPGRRVLRVDFLNDFAAPGSDRNLRLDKIEVVRVADAPRSPAASPSESGAMMAGEPMMAGKGAGEAMTEMMSGGPPSGTDADAPDRWPQSAAMRASRAQPAVIAFAAPIDGATVCGDLEIRSVAWWPGIGDKNSRPPRTTLLLNGHAFAEQIAAAPRFVVPWSAFEPGENRLSLVAQGAAFTARSTEATVTARKSALSLTEPPCPANPFLRFTAHDPHWDAAARQHLSADQSPPERACFALASNADLDLSLPDSLTGEYEIDLEARGQAFKGAPELAVSLIIGDRPEPAPIGVLRVPGNWDDHPLAAGAPSDKSRVPAVVDLPAGPKRLRVSFTNDLYEPNKGDRNVFVQAVVLRSHRTAPEEGEPPHARVIYPADGQPVRAGGADSLVFELDGPFAPRAGAPSTAEIVIDGVPTGQVIDVRGVVGPLVAPVSLRDVPPGPHELSIRLSSGRGGGRGGDEGRTFTTSAIRVEAVPSWSQAPTPYERTLLVLDRFAFGPAERDLALALTMGANEYLQAMLADAPDAPRVREGRDLAAARYPNSSSGADVQRRAILEALATGNPVRARFVLWTENHFSTWIRKTEPRRKADEHDRFSHLGVAPFDQLLLASATSPAMLRYLDQEQSFARRLNENYAREIMELHTLGVNGGYTQEDVTTLARVLTGWTTAREGFLAGGDETPGEDGVGPDEYGMRESFRYEPALGDAQARAFLGRRFAAAAPEDRYPRVLTAIGLLANHPSTARFISRKLVEHYLVFPAPDDAVEDLASAFDRTGGDMPEMLRTLARHPSFWSAPAGRGGSRLAHPPDFSLRLCRCTRSDDAQAVHEYLNLSGRGVFDRSTPDGYQENDSESMDSNAMLQRWKFARRIENPLVELVPAATRAGDGPITADQAQRTIDLLAMRLTGRPLGEASNAAAMELYRTAETAAGRRDERWRTIAAFIASTPEAQLK